MRTPIKLLGTNNTIISCQNENCRYKMACANHKSGGDHRALTGFSPALFEEDGKFYCHTQTVPVDDDCCEALPKNRRRLGAGAVQFINNQFVKREFHKETT